MPRLVYDDFTALPAYTPGKAFLCPQEQDTVDTTTLRPVEILMVEDNPADILLATEALARKKLKNSLHLVHDGAEAMAFLKKEGAYAAKPAPDIIFLDLQMPKFSGQDVLEFIRQNEPLKDMIVVVMIGSAAEENLHRSAGLPASHYMQKPVDLDKFLKLLRLIPDFWVHIVTPVGQGDRS